MLLATGTSTFSRARTLKITIKLAANGSACSKRLRLTVRGTFTPTAQHAVVATKRCTLTALRRLKDGGLGTPRTGRLVAFSTGTRKN